MLIEIFEFKVKRCARLRMGGLWEQVFLLNAFCLRLIAIILAKNNVNAKMPKHIAGYNATIPLR